VKQCKTFQANFSWLGLRKYRDRKPHSILEYAIQAYFIFDQITIVASYLFTVD
jgi:hypothetical protein